MIIRPGRLEGRSYNYPPNLATGVARFPEVEASLLAKAVCTQRYAGGAQQAKWLG